MSGFPSGHFPLAQCTEVDLSKVLLFSLPMTAAVSAPAQIPFCLEIPSVNQISLLSLNPISLKFLPKISDD